MKSLEKTKLGPFSVWDFSGPNDDGGGEGGSKIAF